jgi:hypothetical protein
MSVKFLQFYDHDGQEMENELTKYIKDGYFIISHTTAVEKSYLGQDDTYYEHRHYFTLIKN